MTTDKASSDLAIKLVSLKMEVWIAITLLLGVLTPVAGAAACEDIDTDACRLMNKSNPNLCQEPQLSQKACPRFCKQCPLVCYDCNASVGNFSDCNTTTACDLGEQCMLMHLRSTGDGHHEYKMSCATIELCDGSGLGLAFGRRGTDKRNVEISCCTDDLCNTPLPLTTTTPIPTTASTSAHLTTSSAPTCARDIVVLIEDVDHSSDKAELNIKDFLSSIVYAIDIGTTGNLMEVATVDHSVDRSWDLNDHTDKASLLHAITQLQFEHSTDELDVDDLLSFISGHALSKRAGDRANVPNDIILLLDHRADLNDIPHVLANTKHQLAQLSSDITVINIGAQSPSVLSQLATDNQHVLNVSGYGSLNTIKDQLLALLCT